MVEQELEVATIRTHHLCAMFGYNCHLDLLSLPKVYGCVDDGTDSYVLTWWQRCPGPRVTSNDLVHHCNIPVPPTGVHRSWYLLVLCCVVPTRCSALVVRTLCVRQGSTW